MFDLENAIAQWRRRMEADPGLEPGCIAEIESHLRDRIDDLVSGGQAPKRAFEESVRALGEAGVVGSQFFKVHTRRRSGRPSWQAPRFVNALAWNYFRTAVRFLRRHRGFAVLNIAGLTVGMLSFLLIMTWARNELSYDRFHEKKGRLFTVLTQDKNASWSTTTYALPPALKDGYPEVEDFARVWPWHGSLVRYGELRFSEQDVTLTDPGFFRMFTFPFVEGDPDTALADRNSIVLTEETAHRYFGDEEPMGKVLHLDDPGEDFTVTGVVRNVPPNSSLRFDMVGRVEWLGEERIARWSEWVGPAYVLLRAGAQVGPLNAKIKEIFREHLGRDWPPEPVLQPFTKSHLYADGRPGIIIRVVMFSAIAVLILILACVNFMNLSAIQSIQRAREVGMRKTVGATRPQVIRQLQVHLGANPVGQDPDPLRRQPVGARRPARSRRRGDRAPGRELSRLPPLIVQARRHPARPVRGGPGRVPCPQGPDRLPVRGLAGHHHRLFVRGLDLGLDRNQIVTVQNNLQIRPRLEAFKQELRERPGVLNVTFAAQRPISVGQTIGVDWEGNPGPLPARIGYTVVDYDFFETFGMTIVRGRAFSPSFSDATADTCIVNEAAAKMFGWEDPIGRSITWVQDAIDPSRRNVRIVGVVEDFFDRSLRSEIRPFMLRIWRPWNSYIFVKVDKDRIPEALAGLRATFEKFSPDYGFSYEFLDEAFDRQYAAEAQQGRLFNVFGALSIFIAALGLFGLAAYTTERRIKEIGVRKVMGASTPGLAALLTGEYLVLVGAAVLVAWPVAYYLMSRWLANFVRRTGLSPLYFLAAALGTLVVVLAAVGFRTLQAARANPAECLRYE